MAYFNRKYLEKAYKSKYAAYLDNDDDDKNDDEDDDKDEEDKEFSYGKSSESSPKHLSKNEILFARDKALSVLKDFSKLKKCCDKIDLTDRDHINDDGKRESSFDKYYKSGAKAFIQLMDGDVFGGYPDFRSGGNDDYEEDAKEYVKAVNEELKKAGVNAKFTVGPGKDDEAISFGLKSL